MGASWLLPAGRPRLVRGICSHSAVGCAWRLRTSPHSQEALEQRQGTRTLCLRARGLKSMSSRRQSSHSGPPPSNSHAVAGQVGA